MEFVSAVVVVVVVVAAAAAVVVCGHFSCLCRLQHVTLQYKARHLGHL